VFLPLQTKQRGLLRRFDGVAITHETRVTCARPSFSDASHFSSTGDPEFIGIYLRQGPNLVSDKDFYGYLEGTVLWNATEGSGFPCTGKFCSLSLPIKCRLPVAMDVPPAMTDFFDQLNQRVGFSQSSMCSVAPFVAGRPAVYMVLNVTGAVTDWLPLNQTRLPEPSFDKEWTSYSFSPQASFSTTLCAVSTNFTLDHVQLEGSNPIQPSLERRQDSGSWNMDPVLKLHGIIPTNDTGRGIMTLTNTSTASLNDLGRITKYSDFAITNQNNTVLKYEGPYSFLSELSRYLKELVGGGVTAGERNFTLQFCWTCLPYRGNATTEGLDPHAFHVITFHEVMMATGHAAPAVQSLFTVLAQVLYYTTQAAFDYGGNATVVFSEPVAVPRRWTGFSVVAATTLAHVICVAAITNLFVRRTRYSFYGNAWHAIAQVVSPELAPVLEGATQMTDSQVLRRLRNEHRSRVDSGLERGTSAPRMVVRRTGRPPARNA
jgi:hypothetical protein